MGGDLDSCVVSSCKNSSVDFASGHFFVVLILCTEKTVLTECTESLMVTF